MTDNQSKFAVYPTGCCMIAGHMTQPWTALQQDPPKTFRALQEMIPKLSDDSEVLVYDRRQDKTFYGDLPVGRAYAGIGAGSPIALGALEAMPMPRDLEAAAKAVNKAVEVAIKLNASCGGRIRTVIIPKRGAILVR